MEFDQDLNNQKLIADILFSNLQAHKRRTTLNSLYSDVRLDFDRAMTGLTPDELDAFKNTYATFLYLIVPYNIEHYLYHYLQERVDKTDVTAEEVLAQIGRERVAKWLTGNPHDLNQSISHFIR